MSIAITGSTGQLGRIIINKLKGKVRADDLVALARSTSKAKDLGVSVRKADYDKPETLLSALAGVSTLLLISGSEIGKRITQHHNIIEAAQKVGVGRILYTSLLRAETSPLSLAKEHRHTESELKSCGVPHTILRNGWYTENYTSAIGAALANGALIGVAGDGKISSATRADYAEAAIVLLTSEGHIGKTYELAGDDAYTLSDLAAEISRQTGKTIPYKNLSEAEYVAALVQAGRPEGLAHAVAGWGVCASEGALFDDSRQLSMLIGRPTTPLASAVAAALGQHR